MINFTSESQTQTFALSKTIVGWIILAIFLKIIIKMFYNAFISPLRLIPGPKLCSLSNIPVALRRPEGRVFEWFYQLHREYGSVVRVGPNSVLFSSKEAIRQILIIDDLSKSDGISGIRADPNIETLFSATDRVFHKQRKRLLSPAFSIKYITSFEPLMQTCTKSLVNKLKNIASLTNKSIQFNENGLPIVNIYQLIQATSLDIIGETAFGGSFNLIDNGKHPLPNKVFQELKRRVLYHTFPFIRPFLKKDVWIDEFIQNIIKERRELNSQGIIRNDILQILLDTKDETTNQGLSEFEIQDQTMEFLIAGSDTSSFTINMSLIMLLHHPEKLRKLMNELESTFPSGSCQLPNNEKLKNLKYLNAIINEILRLFPAPMGGILRQTKEDTIIDGYLIPKDTVVSASIYQVHHSKEIWGVDAEEFVPERWTNNNSSTTRLYAFGAGSRLCIGNHFAMAEIRLVLASLLLNFEFEMIKNQDLQLVQFITPALRSKKFDVGIRIKN